MPHREIGQVKARRPPGLDSYSLHSRDLAKKAHGLIETTIKCSDGRENGVKLRRKIRQYA